MSIFNHEYPYTDMHEINLDWIIKQVKRCIEGFEATSTHFATIDEAIEAIIKEFNDFSQSEIFVDKIREALQIMYDDGRLETLMRNILFIIFTSSSP